MEPVKQLGGSVPLCHPPSEVKSLSRLGHIGGVGRVSVVILKHIFELSWATLGLVWGGIYSDQIESFFS